MKLWLWRLMILASLAATVLGGGMPNNYGG